MVKPSNHPYRNNIFIRKHKKNSEKTKKGWWYWGKATVTTFTALIGLLAAAANFLPRLTVEPPSPIAENEAPLEIFNVKNDTFFNLYHVTPMLGLCDVQRVGKLEIRGECAKDRPETFLTFPNIWKTQEIEADHSMPIAINELINTEPANPISYADIFIVIDFRIAFWPFTCTKIFHFKTHLGPDHKIYWFTS